MRICTALSLIRAWQLGKVGSCEKRLLYVGSKDRMFKYSPELAVKEIVTPPAVL